MYQEKIEAAKVIILLEQIISKYEQHFPDVSNAYAIFKLSLTQEERAIRDELFRRMD